MSRKFTAIVIVLLLITICGLTVIVQNDIKQKKQQRSWSDLAGIPELHFEKARQGFNTGDYKIASENLRIAALHIKSVADEAPENEKVILQFSVKRIEKLADDIDNNLPIHRSRFNNAIAIADYQLSNHYHKKALRAWVKHRTNRVGKALKASADYLESAGKWSDIKLKDETVTTIEESRSLSEKLIKDASLKDGEVNSLLQSLEKKISGFKLRMDKRIKEEGGPNEEQGNIRNEGGRK